MQFLKALLWVVLTGLILPLAVKYIEANYPVFRATPAQIINGGTAIDNHH